MRKSHVYVAAKDGWCRQVLKITRVFRFSAVLSFSERVRALVVVKDGGGLPAGLAVKLDYPAYFITVERTHLSRDP